MEWNGLVELAGVRRSTGYNLVMLNTCKKILKNKNNIKLKIKKRIKKVSNVLVKCL